MFWIPVAYSGELEPSGRLKCRVVSHSGHRDVIALNRTHILAPAVLGLLLLCVACSPEPSPQTPAVTTFAATPVPPATATPTLEPTDTAVPPAPTVDASSGPTDTPVPAETLSPSPEPTVTASPAPAATAVPSTPTTQPPPPTAVSVATWHGLRIDDEARCSPYDPDDYPYPQSVEARIVAEMGDIIYGPYTGRWFSSTRETDIEHMVARSEAHDSGLCAADAGTRRRFASDLLNLTLASPSVNRHQKSARDAAEWLPDLNRCWFADRVIRVRQEYRLTIDRAEADALDTVLSGCSSVGIVIVSVSRAGPAHTHARFGIRRGCARHVG